MPDNTVYVGHPTKWGNPYKVGRDGSVEECIEKYEWAINWIDRVKELPELRGKNLACWCPLDKACHADVLLRLANEERE